MAIFELGETPETRRVDSNFGRFFHHRVDTGLGEINLGPVFFSTEKYNAGTIKLTPTFHIFGDT